MSICCFLLKNKKNKRKKKKKTYVMSCAFLILYLILQNGFAICKECNVLLNFKYFNNNQNLTHFTKCLSVKGNEKQTLT